MDTPKVLINLGFTRLVSEAGAQTQTGTDLLTKYQSYLMTTPESVGAVNEFVREASQCMYDKGIAEVLGKISGYISENKTLWSVATACENIQSNTYSYNMLNRNAARQAEKILEKTEEEAVKWIRAGAFKNIMFCEEFRNIAKAVFRNRPVVEHNEKYTQVNPCSMVESTGVGYYFRAAGHTYEIDEDNNVQDADARSASRTFNLVNNLLESSFCNVNDDNIEIKFNGATYTISEANKIVREGNGDKREMNIDQLRENNRLILMSANPRSKSQTAAILESIALMCENYDKIATLDQTTIYSTANDRFLVIEGHGNIYATLLQSNHSSAWTINESAIEALEFIKKNTGTDLSGEYKQVIETAVENADEERKQEIREQLENDEIVNIKDRIATLTESYKDRPEVLAILSKLASEIQEF